MRSSLRSLLTLIWVCLLGYLLALLLLIVQALHVGFDLRATYQSLQRDGVTRQVTQQLPDIALRLKKLSATASGPLLHPWRQILPINHRSLQSLDHVIQKNYQAAQALPNLLGFDRPRKYLVAFQNSAEARGTGGILGAFAILRLDKAEPSIERVGSNVLLQSQSTLPISMPKEFFNIYGHDPAIWQNSNMSPHFPYGAQLWLALWKKQFGEDLDGVMTLDPIVLSQVLKATGPVVVRGRPITSQNVVAETLSDSYLRYEKDNDGRKRYLVEIIEAVSVALLRENLDKIVLAENLLRPLIDNRILLYSTDESIQKTINNAAIAGTLSEKASNEYRLVIQNTAGNKMDYYLARKLTLESKSCKAPRITQARFTISNTSTKDEYLPAYVKGRLDLNKPEGLENSTAVTAMLYIPPNASIVTAMDADSGSPAGFFKRELARQILVIPLDLKAGESRTFIADIEGGEGAIESHTQPLVISQQTRIVDRCSK